MGAMYQSDGMNSLQTMRGSLSPMTGSRRQKLKPSEYMQPGVSQKKSKSKKKPSALKGGNTTILQGLGTRLDPYGP